MSYNKYLEIPKEELICFGPEDFTDRLMEQGFVKFGIISFYLITHIEFDSITPAGIAYYIVSGYRSYEACEKKVESAEHLSLDNLLVQL